MTNFDPASLPSLSLFIPSIVLRSTSAENLATSTPNQSRLSPPPVDVSARRRRPVKRAPSALYGRRAGLAGPTGGDGGFCGPEFVIRARERPRRMELAQVRGL